MRLLGLLLLRAGDTGSRTCQVPDSQFRYFSFGGGGEARGGFSFGQGGLERTALTAAFSAILSARISGRVVFPVSGNGFSLGGLVIMGSCGLHFGTILLTILVRKLNG